MLKLLDLNLIVVSKYPCIYANVKDKNKFNIIEQTSNKTNKIITNRKLLKLFQSCFFGICITASNNEVDVFADAFTRCGLVIRRIKFSGRRIYQNWDDGEFQELYNHDSKNKLLSEKSKLLIDLQEKINNDKLEYILVGDL